MESLLDATLGVKREASIYFGGNSTRHDLQDLRAELDQKVVECGINLLVDVLAMLLSVFNGGVNELAVLSLLRRNEDQGRVGGGILGLVLVDRGKVARIAHHDLLGGQTEQCLRSTGCDNIRCRWP